VQVPDLDCRPTMGEVLKRAAANFGHREFIVMPDRRMTYGQAVSASRRVAKDLLAAGVGKGTRVGFMFPYGTEWLIAWFAAARIGALCMPFSTAYKAGELRKALRHGDVDTLLVPAIMAGQDHLAFVEEAVPGLAAAGREPLRLSAVPYLRSMMVSGDNDRPWSHPISLDFQDEGGPDHHGIGDDLLDAVEAEVTPADLMIAVFTSGTTDEPKGAVHTHGSFLRHGANQSRFAGATSDIRTLCAMPFFWIGGLGLTLNIALHAGTTLLCVERFDPDTVLDLMEAEQATTLAIWPQLGQRLRQHIAATGRDVSRIPAFTPPPGMELPVDPELRHNSLGMTETCGPHSAAGPEANRLLPEDLRGSFGLRVPHVEHRIADPVTNDTLSDGEEGEVCIRGYSLMNGLYKKERYEAFDDDGWYHTGDKGYFKQGYLFFRGRLSEMIKTLGANVAPREVELTLEAFPEVSLAVVLGLPDRERGEIVAAALVPTPGATIDVDDLLERADKELSSYKVPRRVLVLLPDEVPYLGSGKPDKIKIRALLAEDA
jgi:acyl-CoA synthetase (AMP-forming)/AMP-acid ligase II